MVRSWRTLVITTLLAVAALLPVTQGATAARLIGPKAYYLALGDSAAFGFQPSLQFFRGYADDFYANLKTRGVSHYINMGCDAETTDSFINGDSGNHGNCEGWPILKYPYNGPQLAAALNFIKQHPGQISPVTIDIGANDALDSVNTSNCTVSSSFTQTLATIDTNFQYILSQLTTALNGTADIFAMNYWFPYQNQCPQLMPLVQVFDSHLAADAQRYGVPVADVLTAFGGVATPNPKLCLETWICSPYHDIHANSLGYGIIARTFEALAGY